MQKKSEMRYPINIAAIDTGSNGIRFLACRFVSEKDYSIIDFYRAPIRLAKYDSSNGQILDPAAQDLALKVFRSFRDRMNRLNIQIYKAVATSAVRDSSNKDEFVEKVKKETGIELEVISGWEEARLTHLAVKNTMDLSGKKWIMMNLGGGSMEIAMVDDKKVRWCETHNIGVVKILNNFNKDNRKPFYYQILKEYIDAFNFNEQKRFSDATGLIVTGGNIEDIYYLSVNLNFQNACLKKPVEISRKVLKKIINILSEMSYEERIKILKLRPDRADVILPAAMLYYRIAEITDVKKILVPLVGTKEGILFDLIEKNFSQCRYNEITEEELFNAAITLGSRYNFDKNHAIHVTEIALKLFDRLSKIHNLGKKDRNILLLASMLHDIGLYISYKKHHLHSFYLISESDFPVLTEKEKVLVASVARYHRKNVPSLKHKNYKILTESQRYRISVLASLLRIADSLDRSNTQSIKEISPKIYESGIILNLKVKGNIYLDAWSFNKKKEMFTDLFGLPIDIKIESF